MTGIGHNGGPSVAEGASWRAHCWTVARAALLPKLPIEVIRTRVRRAAEIGLDYKTYAGVRATTGHDIVAFLFSTNALRLLRDGQQLDLARAEKLAGLCNLNRLLAVQPPLHAARLIHDLAGQGVLIDHAAQAPGAAQGWSETRAQLAALLRPHRLPPDSVLVIGDTGLEREWVAAGRMAGYLPADRFFEQANQPH